MMREQVRIPSPPPPRQYPRRRGSPVPLSVAVPCWDVGLGSELLPGSDDLA